MKPKLILATLLASVSLLTARADGEAWLWPVVGAETGDGIIYKPQTYIDKQLNFADLFIAAPLDAEVVAPVDGKVTSTGIGYMESMTSSRGGSVDFDKDFDQSVKEFVEECGPRYKAKYVNHTIGLRTDDGRTVYIGGIKLARPFKTGETVSRGEKLGTVRYSYEAIEEPSIKISVSTPRGTVSDPMSPFGIESSFIPPEELKPVKELTAEQARDDINVLVDAFIDCYPSLDDLLPREELEAWRRKETEAITGTVAIADFMAIMDRGCALLHDSHVAYWPETALTAPEYWDINIGRIGDGIKVWLANTGFEQYLNRTVTAVDGIPADSVLRHTARYVSGYDARVEDYAKFMQFARLNDLYLGNFPRAAADRSYTVTFDDGETLKVNSHIYKGEKVKFTPSLGKFSTVNRYNGRNFELKMLDDSTAYIGLATFQLDQVETERIRDFIIEHHHTPHLIFDVRNNGGGHDEVTKKLLSYCTDKPYAAVKGYGKVCRRGNFESFGNSRNYTAEMDDIFGEEYKAEEGRDGLYARGEASRILPDSAAHYGGKLYVLTNELSSSASTLFPAMVMRSHRGLIIGRETRTAYHYMTALKFADICLPNSRVTWRIPLVKCVFDETESPRVPYGRGVVPDIYVPLTYEEVAFTDGDAILNRALKAIADGEYLGENPFAEIDAAPTKGAPAWIWWVAGIVAIIAAATAIRKK